MKRYYRKDTLLIEYLFLCSKAKKRIKTCEFFANFLRKIREKNATKKTFLTRDNKSINGGIEMKKINWKVRFKNPVFLAQLTMSILLPILTYMGLTVEDMTSWEALGNALLSAVENPYVLGLVIVSVWNAVNDPTTSGVTDSSQALEYREVNCDK